MSVDLLEQITRIMKENDLSMIELRDGQQRILLRRGAEYVPTPVSVPATVPQAAGSPAPSQERTGAPPAPEPAGSDDEANLVAIKSPMVGTFYSSPSPDAKPFVTVGSVVNEDTDVCIIEAMKVFNNIKAEVSGVIARVLVNNGQTVEFGQPLFLVKPA
ncbi:MAG: acetyl-CoA carboxylase biotin carboxyl carrier protein [Phycisphaerae bacterium]|nr:acetyl-CoA carboxylase biotin carboxyl carrier protein [Phycisphaerae bacterium]MDW8261351.1 acetyl-CoA carboxylase biotin carboxyl carrier protein [Phycisphaerales bacterium]